jgi:hypothetical protein
MLSDLLSSERVGITMLTTEYLLMKGTKPKIRPSDFYTIYLLSKMLSKSVGLISIVSSSLTILPT